MFSYKGLESKLAERGIGRSDLTKLIGISSRTVAKIGKGEKLSRTVMDKLAAFFECDTEDLVSDLSDNPVLQILREEKKAGISGGLFSASAARLSAASRASCSWLISTFPLYSSENSLKSISLLKLPFISTQN